MRKKTNHHLSKLSCLLLLLALTISCNNTVDKSAGTPGTVRAGFDFTLTGAVEAHHQGSFALYFGVKNFAKQPSATHAELTMTNESETISYGIELASKGDLKGSYQDIKQWGDTYEEIWHSSTVPDRVAKVMLTIEGDDHLYLFDSGIIKITEVTSTSIKGKVDGVLKPMLNSDGGPTVHIEGHFFAVTLERISQ